MKHRNDSKMTNALSGVTAFMNQNSQTQHHAHKPNTINKSRQRQHKSIYGQKSQPTTKPKSSPKPKANVKPKSSNDNYPWTSLIGVKDVAKLNAIQQMFGLSSRTEALELVFKHCQGLLEKKGDRIKYNVLRDVFIQKNMPKAKARYEKYFGKNNK